MIGLLMIGLLIIGLVAVLLTIVIFVIIILPCEEDNNNYWKSETYGNSDSYLNIIKE